MYGRASGALTGAGSTSEKKRRGAPAPKRNNMTHKFKDKKHVHETRMPTRDRAHARRDGS